MWKILTDFSKDLGNFNFLYLVSQFALLIIAFFAWKAAKSQLKRIADSNDLNASNTVIQIEQDLVKSFSDLSISMHECKRLLELLTKSTGLVVAPQIKADLEKETNKASGKLFAFAVLFNQMALYMKRGLVKSEDFEPTWKPRLKEFISNNSFGQLNLPQNFPALDLLAKEWKL